jgi:hypothetical protein
MEHTNEYEIKLAPAFVLNDIPYFKDARNAEQTQQCEVVSEPTWSINIEVGNVTLDPFPQLITHASCISQPIDTNHPDYMRLVVHSMD